MGLIVVMLLIPTISVVIVVILSVVCAILVVSKLASSVPLVSVLMLTIIEEKPRVLVSIDSEFEEEAIVAVSYEEVSCTKIVPSVPM
jgi:hypothetical protein